MRILLISLLAMMPTVSQAADKYQNFAELSANEREGADFQVEAQMLRSRVAVLVIHGGGIEPGSEAVGRNIAGSAWSRYIFEATKPGRNRDLHITSTHFDDRRAIAVAESAKYCISVHGFEERVRDVACVGGGNEAFRDWIARRLQAARLPISVQSPCSQFGGSDSQNIVNRCRNQGAQLELSTHLRQRLQTDSGLMYRFSSTIREAARQFRE